MFFRACSLPLPPPLSSLHSIFLPLLTVEHGLFLFPALNASLSSSPSSSPPTSSPISSPFRSFLSSPHFPGIHTAPPHGRSGRPRSRKESIFPLPPSRPSSSNEPEPTKHGRRYWWYYIRMGRRLALGEGERFTIRIVGWRVLAFLVPRLRCFMPYQKSCVSPFRPTRVSPSSVLSDRFSFSHPFPLLSPDISGFDGVEKRRRRGKQQFCVSGGGPLFFPLPVLPAAIVRVFLPAPFLLKRRKRKKLGGAKIALQWD